MAQRVLIIGLGAQAKYALEIFNLRKMTVLGLIALRGEALCGRIHGANILGSINEFERIYLENNKPFLLLATSKNKIKENLVKKFSKYFPKYINAIHPSSIIATTAQLGAGIIINPNAVIQPYAKIGNHAMLHSCVIVEHDCVISDYVNIAPRATLAGYVKVGKGATIYTGAIILPTIELGAYSIIGAGAVVLKSVAGNVTVAGVPARLIKSKKGKR